MINIVKSTSEIRPRTIHSCVRCAGEWPDYMMVSEGQGEATKYVCCMCKSDAHCARVAKAERKPFRGSPLAKGMASVVRFLTWIVLATALGAALFAGALYGIEVYRTKAEAWFTASFNKDVPIAMVRSELPLKSGSTVFGFAFFVNGPMGPVGIMPAITVPNPDPRRPRVPVFDRWTFVTAGESKQSLKVFGVRQIVETAPGDTFWLVKSEKSADAKTPVGILQPSKDLVGAGARLRLLTLGNSPDGQPIQVSSKAHVDADSADGVHLSVTLVNRLPAKGLIGTPLVSKSGELVAVVTSLGEAADEEGTVGSVDAMSVQEFLKLHPAAPKPAVAKKHGGAMASKKAKTAAVPTASIKGGGKTET